jgi:hypothetical protein
LIIQKILRIREVKAPGMGIAPFQITLDQFEDEKISFLTLDKDACLRFKIPMSLDLVWRGLTCSFEDRELPLKKDESFGCSVINAESLTVDDMSIISLKKTETVSWIGSPPSKSESVLHILELSSRAGSGGFHPGDSLPCPFYRIFLKLSDQEYEWCKALAPTTVFRAAFFLN